MDARREADGEAADDASDPGFDQLLLPALTAIPYFRLAPAHEIDRSFDAYATGDWGWLCDCWCEVAQPTRASLGTLERAYDRAHLLPARPQGLAFLATVRAVLAAGVRFRATLSAPVERALAEDFPWLERRHQHVPAGFTPPFAFPDAFRGFIDVRVATARVRWQLVCALNEVMQAWYSTHAAARFGVPELALHGARERELAIDYLRAWAPPASRALWRQCVLVLDGLNAATFDLIIRRQRGPIVRHALAGWLRGDEWARFAAGLAQPQWLFPLH